MNHPGAESMPQISRARHFRNFSVVTEKKSSFADNVDLTTIHEDPAVPTKPTLGDFDYLIFTINSR
jgi:hypothetical protein